MVRKQLGIPVFAARTVDTAGIYANLGRFGTLLDMAPEADSLAAWVRGELDVVRGSWAGRPPVDAAYLIGLDPPTVAGPRVFIGEVLEVAGGRNVFADLSAPSPPVSLEELVRRRPAVVLIPTDVGSSALEGLRRSPGWRELAGSGTRFEALPSDLLHRPGPSIVEAARAIRDVLHPQPPAAQ